MRVVRLEERRRARRRPKGAALVALALKTLASEKKLDPGIPNKVLRARGRLLYAYSTALGVHLSCIEFRECSELIPVLGGERARKMVKPGSQAHFKRVAQPFRRAGLEFHMCVGLALEIIEGKTLSI